jgi:hypothetical protein
MGKNSIYSGDGVCVCLTTQKVETNIIPFNFILLYDQS